MTTMIEERNETAGTPEATGTAPIENLRDVVRFLEKQPELDQLRIELIDGRIVLQASAAPFHNRIVSRLTVQFEANGWATLAEQALFSAQSSWEPKADLTVTTEAAIADNANPFPCERADLVVEVVSGDRDNDHLKKLFWYGTVGVPLYLIVDPNDGLCLLHSQPKGNGYRTVRTTEFGIPVELPEPFGFALDTTAFRVYPPKR